MSPNSKAQSTYGTSGIEMIFGVSDISFNDITQNSALRWTVFLNGQSYYHLDLNNNIGFYSGVAVRNVGFITKDETIEDVNYETVKRRSYTLGIPLAIKLGSFDNDMFIYGGAEYEWLFVYKEKHFLDGDKIHKDVDWFSNRTNSLIPSVFAGIALPSGLNVTFKYYLKDFMNTSYVDSFGNRPYDNMVSQVYYISVSKVFRWASVKHTISNWDAL